jgi:isopenicillin N synthase-like dioxygenase
VLPAVGKERLSIPFFFEPNLDTVVQPLESCRRYAGNQKFESVLFADHLRAKVLNNFSFL